MVMSRFCGHHQHEGLVLQKASMDLALAIIWIPTTVVKVTRVSRQTCYSYWTEERCEEWVHSSIATPAMACICVVAIFAMVYYYLWQEIKDIMSRENPEISEFYVYSYFAIFLWLHMYWSAAWIVTCGSMYFWHMIILIAVGIAQDAMILSRVMVLRDPSSHKNKLLHVKMASIDEQKPMLADPPSIKCRTGDTNGKPLRLCTLVTYPDKHTGHGTSPEASII
mmetsp:Transcript_15719/g.28235  ORF Transcript_15719/g.28235 Transcript_15719/m.28235 type:complete len:223 (+) Transcript_15719:59-727(+)